MNNFRDIGCENVRKGLLFRGAECCALTNEDKELLFDRCGIRTIIDLRSAQEVEAKKDDETPSVRVINVPLLSIEEMSATVQGQFPDVVASYRASVNRKKKEVWTQIFDALLNNDEGAILFHCTQGKDRTGIVVAVVLAALGASKQTIYDDYLLTNKTATMPEQYRQYAETMPDEVRKLFNGLFFVDQDFLEEAFWEIDREFGSLEGFLGECCSLDETKLIRLKQKYANCA